MPLSRNIERQRILLWILLFTYRLLTLELYLALSLALLSLSRSVLFHCAATSTRAANLLPIPKWIPHPTQLNSLLLLLFLLVAILVVGCVSKLPNFFLGFFTLFYFICCCCSCWALQQAVGAINVLSCQRSAVRNCDGKKRNQPRQGNATITNKVEIDGIG